MLAVALLISGAGTILMALGVWLNFTADNPVFKAIYICVVTGFTGVGFLMLHIIKKIQDPED